jgi:hypothetical protein
MGGLRQRMLGTGLQSQRGQERVSFPVRPRQMAHMGGGDPMGQMMPGFGGFGAPMGAGIQTRPALPGNLGGFFTGKGGMR